MLDRFSIYPVTPNPPKNAPSSFVTISQSFIAKEAWGYAKIILKKREKEREKYRKNGQVSKRKIDE
jgi:hypothetical protein